MAKSPRMEQLESLLAADPNDPFLRYGLAMEHISQGDDSTAVAQLRELIGLTQPKPYIPAYLMAGQALIRMNEEQEAATMLREGIEAARQAGEVHAQGEMEGFLATLE